MRGGSQSSTLFFIGYHFGTIMVTPGQNNMNCCTKLEVNHQHSVGLLDGIDLMNQRFASLRFRAEDVGFICGPPNFCSHYIVFACDIVESVWMVSYQLGRGYILEHFFNN